jgi:hypothetical protein
VLSFSAFEKPYLLEGKVIRKLEHPWPGIAVQFNLGTRDQVAMIRSLIKEVRKSGAPETRPRIPVTKDFSDWWSRAAKNPRLLVLPEVPEHYQRKQERPTTGAAQ